MTATKLVITACMLLLSGPAWAQGEGANRGGPVVLGQGAPPSCPEVVIPECKPGEASMRQTFILEGTSMRCHRYSPCHDRWDPPFVREPDVCDECPKECVTKMTQELNACLEWAGDDYDAEEYAKQGKR